MSIDPAPSNVSTSVLNPLQLSLLPSYRAMFYGQWSENACNRLYLAMPILATLGMLCAEGVCCIRIWTIHKRNPLVLSILAVFLSATACIQSYGITNYVAFREGGSCVAAGRGLWLTFYWIAPAILDVSLPVAEACVCWYRGSIAHLSKIFTQLVILTMAMIAVAKETRKFGRNRLLNVILRDQVLYFFLVFSACIISGVLMGAQSSYLQSLNNPPAITVSSVGATRVVLSLKKEGSRIGSSYNHGHQQASNSGASSRWTGKKGVLSWWTTASSSGNEKGLTSESARTRGYSNPKSWLQMSSNSPIASVDAPGKWEPDSPSRMLNNRDIEVGNIDGQQHSDGCDVVQIIQTSPPPVAFQKASAIYFLNERSRINAPSSPVSNSTSTDATTLTSIAEHGHDGQQQARAGKASKYPHQHPYTSDRLVGLGDTTQWLALADQQASRASANIGAQDPASDLTDRTASPTTGTRFKSWSHKGHGLKSEDFTGLSPQYNGCYIKTTTTTSVSRSSGLESRTTRDIDELTGDLPSPILSEGFVSGLPVDQTVSSRGGEHSDVTRHSQPSTMASEYDEASGSEATATPKSVVSQNGC